jgi:NADPH:quinone reductase
LSGAKKYDEPTIAQGVQIIYTFVGTAHEGRYRPNMPKQPLAEEAQGDVEFAGQFSAWLEKMLEQGRYSGHPYEVIPGGLQGVAEGLDRLRNGQAGGKKFVYRIA